MSQRYSTPLHGLSPLPLPPERRRRLLLRALPVSALALGSFVVGAIVGGSDELGAAKRFVEAWESRDYETMHAELTEPAQRRHSEDELRRAYERAAATATLTSVAVEDVDGAEQSDGTEAASARVILATNAFGTLAGELILPLSQDRVEWAPHLAFPGLREDEQLERRTRAPDRAPILARDGTPLAEGPAVARSSPLGRAARAVAGGIGTPKREARRELFALGFPKGSLAGTNGLELAFNERLAGRPGGQLLAMPKTGKDRRGRLLASSEPAAGKPLRTSIDPELQGATVAALSRRLGGIAVLDARDGSVRALAGLAFSAPQPPGSTFKMITAVAALETGLVSPADEFPVQTSVFVGGREIANAHDESCGGTFVESFADSCNSVFALLGAQLGSEQLVEAAKRFGFNSRPSLYERRAMTASDPPAPSLPESLSGNLEEGVTAIGQGQVLSTPLHMASVAQAIAAGGIRSPTPIVKDPELRAEGAEPVRVTSEETATTVRDMMVAVVNDGTGTAAALPDVRVAGKTGTAELGPKPLKPGEELEPDEEPEQEVDAWFAAFAPAADPEIVVAVMIVKADGDGGEIAAPIAREVLAAKLG